MEEKLINADKLREIIKDVFSVFEKYKLSSGEIEFVISDLKKLSDFYRKKLINKK